MQSVLSSFPAAVYLDRAAALAELRRLAERLVSSRPAVRSVLLFGSLAAGRGDPTSDADLLVVLEASDLPRRADRVPDLLEALAGAPLPLDVHAYTAEELEEGLRRSDPLLAEALRGALLLAGAELEGSSQR